MGRSGRLRSSRRGFGAWTAGHPALLDFHDGIRDLACGRINGLFRMARHPAQHIARDGALVPLLRPPNAYRYAPPLAPLEGRQICLDALDPIMATTAATPVPDLDNPEVNLKIVVDNDQANLRRIMGPGSLFPDSLNPRPAHIHQGRALQKGVFPAFRGIDFGPPILFEGERRIIGRELLLKRSKGEVASRVKRLCIGSRIAQADNEAAC